MYSNVYLLLFLCTFSHAGCPSRALSQQRGDSLGTAGAQKVVRRGTTMTDSCCNIHILPQLFFIYVVSHVFCMCQKL